MADKKVANLIINYQTRCLTEFNFKILTNIFFGNGLQGGNSVSADNTGFIQQIQTYGNAGIQVNGDLFNFWNKHYMIKAELQNVLAQKSNLKKNEIEIRLNVTQAYLQTLLSQQQIYLSQVQISQTRQQLQYIQKSYVQGNVTESNLIEIEAQLSRDSLQWIANQNTFSENLLQLKATMFFDFQEPLEIDTIQKQSNFDLILDRSNPQFLYEQLKKNWPQLKILKAKLNALENTLKASKTKTFPSLNFSLGLNSNLIYSPALSKNIGEGKLTTSNSTIGYWVNPSQNAESVPVYSFIPTNTYETYRAPNLLEQIKNNYNFSVVTTLAIPIFQGWNNRYQTQNILYEIENQKTQIEFEKNKLGQNIYQIFISTQNAFKKWQGSLFAEKLSLQSYTLAQKKFYLGNESITELITIQNLYQKSTLEKLSAYYDFIFKKAILNVYLSLEEKYDLF